MPNDTIGKLPGFNIPYNFADGNRFASITSEYNMPLTTIREFTMLRLMNQITDKSDWHIKVFNDEIANRWKQEALEMPNVDITQEMVDWCIEELRYKARIYGNTGMVTVYNGDVVKSDIAIPEDCRIALNDAVKPLEDVPPSQRDWHPGSDEKVLDLVHPSLFPLIYGLTRILPESTTTLDDCIARSGEGVKLELFEDKDYFPRYVPQDLWVWQGEMSDPFSRNFQWLPCDVDISGNTPMITSYINNLHPLYHKELYSIIERIIGHAIPLWNECLTRQKTPSYSFNRVECDEAGYEGGDESWEEDFDPPAVQPRINQFQLPNKSLFELDGITLKPDFKVDLKKYNSQDGIQVIVKLANIHLTPEKPEYEGGTWHVEGQHNEHICATALYYYSSDNITPSHLSFRQLVDVTSIDEIPYEQNYHRWIKDVFGCDNGGPAIQDVGSIATRQGRLIAFPNILQHQVQPFRLADPTKPGHRKILALFLVDPDVKVISTANVPCQRLDWWREKVDDKNTRLGRLPVELKDHVYAHLKFPISMEKAKDLRLKLMDERKRFVVAYNKFMEGMIFSLCEH